MRIDFGASSLFLKHAIAFGTKHFFHYLLFRIENYAIKLCAIFKRIANRKELLQRVPFLRVHWLFSRSLYVWTWRPLLVVMLRFLCFAFTSSDMGVQNALHRFRVVVECVFKNVTSLNSENFWVDDSFRQPIKRLHWQSVGPCEVMSRRRNSNINLKLIWTHLGLEAIYSTLLHILT